MKAVSAIAVLATTVSADPHAKFNGGMQGSSCTEWKLVSQHTGGGSVNLDPNMEKSPVGIYRATNAATIGASTQSLYIKDSGGWKSENMPCQYCWNTYAQTESDYPTCSSDGGTWNTLWDLSGTKTQTEQSGENQRVGKHRDLSGNCCGWLLLHNGATYPGGEYSSSPDVHPCAVSGSHTTGRGAMEYMYACMKAGEPVTEVDAPADNSWANAKATCEGMGMTLASKEDICGTSLTAKIDIKGDGAWVPVADAIIDPFTGQPKASSGEYLYVGRDWANVSGNGDTLRSCTLHYEWPAHYGSVAPGWSGDSSAPIKASKIYCAGTPPAPTPPPAPVCTPTPASAATVSSTMNFERTSGSARFQLLQDGVMRLDGATCLEANLCNTCGLGGGSSSELAALQAQITAVQTELTQLKISLGH
jgi:hypothetical protein